MEAETRSCQNCKKDFTIEPEDFNFYEKIKVPPPTFCFDCRAQRKMMFRNERALYRRENNAPGKEGEQIISIHRPDAAVTVYDDRTWWSDAWDPLSYGKLYDFSKPFFTQFKELYRKIPLISLSVTNNMNCNFCNVSAYDKGSYMLSASGLNEDVVYSNRAINNKISGDLYIAFENELCYELINCTKCYRTLYSMNSQECVDSFFLFNCKNCTDCIGCANLRNQSHCIFNVKYSKEEYEAKRKELNLDTRNGIDSFEKLFKDFYLKQFFKFANNVKADDSTGDNLVNVSKSLNVFDFKEAERVKNCFWGSMLKDSYDIGGAGLGGELIYEIIDVGVRSANSSFGTVIYGSFDVQYSINCHSSKHLFGCYGLRSKQYCILNKQYSKEEYEELLPKIKQHMSEMPYMDAKGRIFKYGEFFPYDLSPFAYNETIAQEYFPLTKEEVQAKGFEWYERPARNYSITMKNEHIPDSIDLIPEGFSDEVIECLSRGDLVKQCTEAFKVIPQEIELYKRLGIPPPHYCYNCRHYNRLQKRNPMKLWHRTCMCDKQNHFHGTGKCEVEFETSYAPDRPEIVYCEKCYQQEVY